MKKIIELTLFVVGFIFLSYDSSFCSILEVGPSQPYTTIQAAINAANAGDIINIHSGLYTENITVSKSVTLRADASSPAPPTIDPAIDGTAISISANGVTIDGMEITGWTGISSHGISYSGRDSITILNNIIHNGINRCIDSRNSTRVTIQDNEIYACTAGIVIHSSHSTDATYSNGTLIKGNTIHDNPADGIDIHGEYITVEYNNIYSNIDSNWTTTHPDGIQFTGSLVDGYDSVQHAKVRFNVIKNHNQNIFVSGYTAADEIDAYIYGNVIYNDSGTVNGADLDAMAASGIVITYAAKIYIYNNTIGRQSNNDIYLSGNNGAGSIYIKNNIIDGPAPIGIYTQTATDIASGELDYNLYDDADLQYAARFASTYYSTLSDLVSGTTMEDHGVFGNPNISYPIATLSRSSPATDVGIDLGSNYNMDIVGTTRPQGSAWDIGAYEALGPSPPQNLRIQP